MFAIGTYSELMGPGAGGAFGFVYAVLSYVSVLLTFVAEEGLPLVFQNGDALVADVYVFV